MIDQHHDISLLSQCNQRGHETVAIYGDRYTKVAEKSQVTIQNILVHYIVDDQRRKELWGKDN